MHETAAIVAVIDKSMHTAAHHHGVAVGDFLQNGFAKLIGFHAVAVQKTRGVAEIVLQRVERVFDVRRTRLRAEGDANCLAHIQQQTAYRRRGPRGVHLLARAFHQVPEIGGRSVGFVAFRTHIERRALERPLVEIEELRCSCGHTSGVGGFPAHARCLAVVGIALPPLRIDERFDIAPQVLRRSRRRLLSGAHLSHRFGVLLQQSVYLRRERFGLAGRQAAVAHHIVHLALAGNDDKALFVLTDEKMIGRCFVGHRTAHGRRPEGNGVAQIVARNGGRLPAIDRIGLRRCRHKTEGGHGERERKGLFEHKSEKLMLQVREGVDVSPPH